MDISELSVVLVEPSSTQRKIIKSHLSQLGVLHIELAKSMQEALTILASGEYDLVVSSLYLQGCMGTDLLHTMRDDEALKSIAFILISSETDIEVLDPIRQAGSIAILSKPFTIKGLSRALHSTIDYYTNKNIDLGCYEPETLKVLLVDDSRMARNHMKRVLGKMGLEQFTEAENGVEAKELLEEEIFDLVVTDYNMPEMDGQQLTQFIRTHSMQQSIPVLMVTSEENDNRLASVAHSGVSAICDKPFEASTVRALIEGFFADA